jgi:hypothetical protein
MKKNKEATQKSSTVLTKWKNQRTPKKKITEELHHIKDSKFSSHKWEDLKKKKATEEQHHSEDPPHSCTNLFFLVYVIHVIILGTKM